MSIQGSVSDDNALLKGWLSKWTNLVKGYKRRWFVLALGSLSYYRDEPEAAHTLRGFVKLKDVLIYIHSDDCTFILSKNDTNLMYLKAANNIERQKWVKALERSKRFSIAEPESVIFNEHHKNVVINVCELSQNIEEIQLQLGSLVKKTNIFKERSSELIDKSSTDKIANLKIVTDELKTCSRSLINCYMQHYDLAKINCHDLEEVLEDEIKHRVSLQHFIKELQLLQTMLDDFESAEDKKHKFTEINEFCNDVSSNVYFIGTQYPRPKIQRDYPKRISIITTDELHDIHNEDNYPQVPTDVLDDVIRHSIGTYSTMGLRQSHCEPSYRLSIQKEKRKTIPEKPNLPINMWSVLKNSIGKDITKIPMPVNFCEPLSFLQRLAEDFYYSYLLDIAAKCQDPVDELAFLAAFTISTYASTVYRTAKPFNPLLGETFELDRFNDLGWRLITEQVSHHPPISAQFCEGKEWVSWQEVSMSSKFRGKYIQITPLGSSHIEFKNSGNQYSWNRATTIVYNIIIGKLWVDQQGEVEILNVRDISKCVLTYFPYSNFKTDEQRKVTGKIFDNDGNIAALLEGKWDSELTLTKVQSPKVKTLLWKAEHIAKDREKYYFFNEFACQLNEMDYTVAPTDSRRRPDQRLMELGRWDEANEKKLELEENQRKKKKTTVLHSGSAESFHSGGGYSENNAIWFKSEVDPFSGTLVYVYNGGYWETKASKNWTNCPHIF